MAKGGDSKSEGREFKSQRPILDGHFFEIICCKFVPLNTLLQVPLQLTGQKEGVSTYNKHFFSVLHVLSL